MVAVRFMRFAVSLVVSLASICLMPAHAADPGAVQAVVYRFARFDSSPRDADLSEADMRAAIERVLESHGLRWRELPYQAKGVWLQFETDTLYIPNGTDTRVMVFKPRLMSNGKEACGITGKSWGTGSTSAQRMRNDIAEGVRFFIKSCLKT
jgi:hypothetical protein